MALKVVAYPHELACRNAVVALAREALEQDKRPVLLVASYDQQLAMQKQFAQWESGFAITVTTLSSWTRELWELFGDGSSIISAERRMVALWKLLCANRNLQQSPGVLNLLCRCAMETTLHPGEHGLSGQERAAVELLGQYLDDLHGQGLVEHPEALARLATEPARKRYAPLALGMRKEQLGHAQLAFLDSWNATLVHNDMSSPSPAERADELLALQSMLFRRSNSQEPIRPSGALHVSLAAGPSASQRAVLNEITRAIDLGLHDIVVASPRSRAAFDFSLPPLGKLGATCTLSARSTFAETDLGRALLDLGNLISADDLDDPLQATPLIAADYSHNPFAAIAHGCAFGLDKMHRGDRLMGQGAILSDLAGNADDSLQGLIGLLEDRDYIAALDILHDYLNRRFVHLPAYHDQQQRALDVARNMCEAGPDVPFGVLMQMVARSSVAANVCCVSSEDETADAPLVRFMTQEDAARLDPASVDCVIAADLNAESFSIREPEDALATLLGKLGVARQADPLAHMRETFYRTLEAARHLVVIQRSLNNESGDPTQAATVFEELLDCYRPNVLSDEGMDRTLGIPESLVAHASQIGEQDVLANTGAGQRNLQKQLLPITGTIDADARNLIVLPHRYAQGTFDGIDLSPSQIESYLECPYNWFAKRRLRLEELDEGFSPRERGTFMHDVLCRFYERFQAEVQPKVTVDTLELARRIMTDVFEAVSVEQPRGRLGSRYVPRTAWERKEQQAVLPKLLRFLEMETELLPTFSPCRLEWQFASDKPLPYASCNLRGCVDRIDVDARGRAVVIDYKSSLNNDYRLYDSRAKEPLEHFELPRRLQALMYAKVVREYFGYQIVGALYVNPLKCEVLGAYDATEIGNEDIPFVGTVASRNCQVPYPGASTFDELLDTCETVIAQQLTNLQAGQIEPNPSHDGACEYCPVNICPKRLSPRKD